MTTRKERVTGLRNWSTRDMMILIALVLVLAVVSAIASYLRTVLEAGLGPVGNRLVMIINIVILFVPPYLLRKPLTAVLASFFIGLVSLPFSPFGLVSIVGYLVGGAIVEIIFAAGRYRNYSLKFLLIAGVIYNTITLGLIWVPLQVGALSALGIAAVLTATVVGGMLGGWFTKLIGDGIIKSGVMSAAEIEKVAEDV